MEASPEFPMHFLKIYSMPDIVLVPTSVVAESKGQYLQGTADFSATAGQVCALESTSGRYILASAATEALSQVRGIATHAASVGQPLRLLTQGVLDLGSDVLVPGARYCVARNAGHIAPYTDLGAHPLIL
jgi:hypothetical protein